MSKSGASRPSPWRKRTPKRANSAAHRAAVASSGARFTTLGAQLASDAHGHLQRLLVVQARVHARAVRAAEISLRQPPGAADALGDVLAGALEVDPPEH